MKDKSRLRRLRRRQRRRDRVSPSMKRRGARGRIEREGKEVSSCVHTAVATIAFERDQGTTTGKEEDDDDDDDVIQICKGSWVGGCCFSRNGKK